MNQKQYKKSWKLSLTLIEVLGFWAVELFLKIKLY